MKNKTPARRIAQVNKWYFANWERCQSNRKKWAEKNHETVQDYLRKWKENNREYLREYMRAWRRRNSDKVCAYSKKYRDTHPEATRAHGLAKTAQLRGEIITQPCAHCGGKKTEKHHPDYSKPTKVIWLCFLCHQKLHWSKKI